MTDLGTIRYNIDADTSGLARGEERVDGFRRAAGETTSTVNRTGSATEQASRKVDRASGKMERSFVAVKGAIKGATVAIGAIAASAGAVTAVANEVSKAARETENLAEIANASVEDLQRMSFASQEVGVTQQQLAQTMLDVQDRVGDFLQTGAGEFADFFENIAPQVGLTAQELARMSGPDALQAVYHALDQANLSASETRFYMEALASDSSRLIPLLKNNAEGFRDAAGRADELNAVLSESEVENLSDMADEFGEIRATLDARMAKAIEENSDAIEGLANRLVDVAEAGLSAAEGIGAFASAVTDSGLGQEVEKVSSMLPKMLDSIFEVSGQARAVRDFFAAFDDGEGALGRIDPLIIRDLGDGANDSIGTVRTLGEEMDNLASLIPSLEVRQLSAEFEALDQAANDRIFDLAEQGVQDMRDQVNPGRAELREFREQVDLLNTAVEWNIISSGEAADLQQRLSDGLSDQASGVRTVRGEMDLLGEAMDRVSDKSQGFAERDSEKILQASQTMQQDFGQLGVTVGETFNNLSDQSKATFAALGAGLSNISQIAKEGGEDTFQTYKRLAQAQAAVATSLAVAQALAAPIPPPGNIALATTIGALGAVEIAAIEQQEFQAREMGGPVQGGQTYLVGERGPELVTMNGSGNVTPNHRLEEVATSGSRENQSPRQGEGQRGGDTNVTQVFQLSDNARREAKQQILESAPMIRSMAQQAVLEARQNGGPMAKAMGGRS